MEPRHQLAVSQLSRSLRSGYEQDVPFSSVASFSSSSSGSLRKMSSLDGQRPPPSANKPPPFTSIIRVDPTRRTALVEPEVSFENLVNAASKYNLVPAYVSRYPHITVGAAFSTTSIESSSFKCGLFHHSVHSIEVVLQNGDVRRASPRENADLFNGMINTRSTLATLTLLEVRLIPAAPFVELSYLPVSSADEAITLLDSVVHDDAFDYIDCILFSPNRGVVMVGRSTPNRNVHPIRRLLRQSDPLFHKHAEACLAKSLRSHENHTELIPHAEYLFRYSASVFWLTSLTSTSSSDSSSSDDVPAQARLTRPTTEHGRRLRKAHNLIAIGGLSQRILAADLMVPSASAPALLNYITSHLSVFPLWLCPSLDTSTAPFHTWTRTSTWPLQTASMLLNVGVYGAPGPKTRLGIINNNSGNEYSTAFVAANKDLERLVGELGGQKCWTGPIFCNEDEFWAGLDRDSGNNGASASAGGREGYAKLRARCGAEGLPGLWDACRLRVDEVASARDSFSRPSMSLSLLGTRGTVSSMSARSSMSLMRMPTGNGIPGSMGSLTKRSGSIRGFFKREVR